MKISSKSFIAKKLPSPHRCIIKKTFLKRLRLKETLKQTHHEANDFDENAMNYLLFRISIS